MKNIRCKMLGIIFMLGLILVSNSSLKVVEGTPLWEDTVTNDKFSPNMVMTRGMFVTEIGRLANADVSNYKDSKFTDVKSDAYYMGSVGWASENGMVEGIGNEKFAPDQSITREQIAVILMNYAQYRGYDTTQGGMAIREFEDYESISEYALHAMAWAVNTGLIQGSDINLMPKQSATHAQVAAILMRFSETIATEDDSTKGLKIMNIPVDFIHWIDNLESLEELSDIIIRAEVLPEREEVILIDNDYGFTKTKLKVTKVYSGNVGVDDIITVCEEYFESTNNITGEIYLEALDFYTPATIGEEYIFFLYDNHLVGTVRENMYEMTNIRKGRYPLTKDDLIFNKASQMPSRGLKLSEKEIATYKSIYDEVVKKYH